MLKTFTSDSARPLPLIVLVDTSGSMAKDGKIQALNLAMREMLEAFRDEEDLRAEIRVAVVTFGAGRAVLHAPLTAAATLSWSDLVGSGDTPLGGALDMARALIEDRAALPNRAYRPTIVLISDGQPTDHWKPALDALLTSERGGKALRMAMGIGADADLDVLRAFLNDPAGTVHKAEGAREIRQFLQFVTMSVTSRSRSANPNAAPSQSETLDP